MFRVIYAREGPCTHTCTLISYCTYIHTYIQVEFKAKFNIESTVVMDPLSEVLPDADVKFGGREPFAKTIEWYKDEKRKLPKYAKKITVVLE